MKCPYCQAEIQDCIKYCTECGAAQAAAFGGVPDIQPRTAPVYTKSLKEFLSLPENKSLRAKYSTAGILCYVCGGVTALLMLISKNYYAVIDIALLVGLGLGVHIGHSKVCAVLLAVYAVINMVVTFVTNGSIGGWLVAVAAIFGCIATFQGDKAWKDYMRSFH